METSNTNKPNTNSGYKPSLQQGGFRPNQGGPQRGGYNNQRGGRGGGRFNNRPGQNTPQESEFFEKVVKVNRVSKKTAGGDKRSLSILVVVGDRKGKVGVGLGKAADVQSAVRKATTYAKKHLIDVPLKGTTIPHPVFIKMGAAKIILKPAPLGTGVIAGGAVRVVVEAAGIHDVVSKILGTSNQASNVYTTLEALKRLKRVKVESRIQNSESSNEKKRKKLKRSKRRQKIRYEIA
jgi:small subunit ribosomal protein S5